MISTNLYITNAPTIDNLEGTSYQVGTSVAAVIQGLPLAGGGDLLYMEDSALDQEYFGLSSNFGFGSPGA